jgi:hypothetical protein
VVGVSRLRGKTKEYRLFEEGGVQEPRRLVAWALILLSGSNLNTGLSQSFGIRLTTVSKANLCVTEGAIEELPGQQLSVNVPKMRAYVNAYTQPMAEVRFTYIGSTPNEAPLASGEMRRQFGLKLRAQDACNLVYAMWRIEPESKLVVSVKSNPGEHTSAQCGNRGYQNIKPRRSSPVAALSSGGSHLLRAQMNGAEMQVFADNSLVWEGSVGADALSFDGPVGIRSDNARLLIDLRTGAPIKQQPPGCRGEESE